MGGPAELFPAGFGYSLWVTYAVWIGIVLLLLATQDPRLIAWITPAPGPHWFDYLNPFGREHNVAPWIILSCHLAMGIGVIGVG